MSNNLIINQENKLKNIGQQMGSFPEIKVSGALIIDNYNEQIQSLNNIINLLNDFNIKEIMTDEGYWSAIKVLKGLKIFQSQLKEGLKVLDDEKITKLRELTLDATKLIGIKCGKTVGGLEFLIDFYKQKAVKRIIDCGFTNIINQPDFIKTYEEFETYCLEQFKGVRGLKFEELQDKALRIAANFNNEMELQQLKFEKNIIELKKFCDEIGYISDLDILKIISKKLTYNQIETEDAELQLREKKEEQEKAIQKKIEFEKHQEKLRIEKELQFEKLESKKLDNDKSKKITEKKEIVFTFFITESEKKEIVELLSNNGFHYFKLN